MGSAEQFRPVQFDRIFGVRVCTPPIALVLISVLARHANALLYVCRIRGEAARAAEFARATETAAVGSFDAFTRLRIARYFEGSVAFVVLLCHVAHMDTLQMLPSGLRF